MRSGSLSLGFLLLFGGACSQIIGLGDYENTDAVEGSGGDSHTGGTSAKGGGGGSGGVGQGGRGGATSTGGTNTGEGGASGGEPGSSGAGPEGGVGAQGGVGNAGSGAGGASGEGGEPGATGGTSAGGTLGTGGTATGGTLNTGGSAGKGGSGGATGGTGGKGGSGGTTGGTGGKGGSGGTTGGTTCSTTDVLLNNNPNFDNSSAAPPDPAPWVQDSTAGTVVINRQAFLTNAGVTAHTAGNAAWLGGVGSDYTFTDTKGGTGEVYVLDLDLTIPVGVTQVTLSCYYQTQTDETTATIPSSRDLMIAWLWDYDLDENAYEFQRWTPANSTPGWHLFTNTASGAAATALAGRALSLEFYSEVDSTLASDFFIDTCSLKVTVCN